MVLRLKKILNPSVMRGAAVLIGEWNTPETKLLMEMPTMMVIMQVIRKAIAGAVQMATAADSDGYRDVFSSDRSSPDNDIIDRSEVHGSGIRESETSPAPFSDKTAESGWSKYYPYIIGVLACICLVLLIVIYRLSSTKKDTCKSLEKFEGITEELGDAVKKQPITEDKLREIIRKHII